MELHQMVNRAPLDHARPDHFTEQVTDHARPDHFTEQVTTEGQIRVQ